MTGKITQLDARRTSKKAKKETREEAAEVPKTPEQAPEAEIVASNGHTPEAQTAEEQPQTVAQKVAASLNANRPARARKSADGTETGVTRYSKPAIWHGQENQPSLTNEQAGELIEALVADRRNYAKYNRIFKTADGGKESDEAKAAKTVFDTHHANYVAKCKAYGVLPGGF